MDHSFLQSLSYSELCALVKSARRERDNKNPELIALRELQAKHDRERDMKEVKLEQERKAAEERLRAIVRPGDFLRVRGCRDGQGVREFIGWDNENRLVCWKIEFRKDWKTRTAQHTRTNFTTTHYADKVVCVINPSNIWLTPTFF